MWAHCRRLVLKTASIVCWTQTRAGSGCYCSKKIWALVGVAELFVESPLGPPGRSSREVTHCLLVCTVSWLWNPTPSQPSPCLETSLEEGVSPLHWLTHNHTSFHWNVRVKSPWWHHLDSEVRTIKCVVVWRLICRPLIVVTSGSNLDPNLRNRRNALSLVSVGQ